MAPDTPELTQFYITGFSIDSLLLTTILICAVLSNNEFAGTIPSVFSHLSVVVMLDLSHNSFEGSIPWIDAQAFLVGYTHLRGSIPQQLLDGWDPIQKALVASEVQHEGTFPASASRLTMAEIFLSVGHGLRGSLPSIPGTVELLSLWENSLEGDLHELRIMNESLLFFHANAFSCQVPRNGDVKPNYTESLALIGNHFTQPRELPAWITPAERPAGMFCLSNKQGTNFVMLLACGACLFGLTACISVRGRQGHRFYGQFARARSAWHETCQQYSCLLLGSCSVLLLHISVLSLSCTLLSDHLRFHFVADIRPAAACLVSFVHMCQLAASRNHRHKSQTWMVQQQQVRHDDQWWRDRNVQARRASLQLRTRSRVYSFWLFVCVLTSAPGVLYSAVKAVPGFLQVSDFWRWVLSSSVALCSGVVTGFGLDLLAKKLSGPTVDGGALQLVGMFLASILLPGLVTMLCQAKCLGAWTSYWELCRKAWSFDSLVTNLDKAVPRVFKEVEEHIFTFNFDIVSRVDICSLRWQMDAGECVEAVIERLVWLLYPKFTHYCFTMTSFRVLRLRFSEKRMTLRETSVLLNYTWLVMTLFGPYLPVLSALAALLTRIYSSLLFGCDLQLLDMEDRRGA